ncbi:MAG: hypothetical protein JWM03_1249 [Rhodocyclales bacterium]|nr:hypothetical protein [Rhodocyclales bacterium]
MLGIFNGQHRLTPTYGMIALSFCAAISSSSRGNTSRVTA